MFRASMIAEMRQQRRSLPGKVTLVPTMGALHAGHLSLIERGRMQSDNVIVSIFVNPTQFGPREDFGKYPRPIDEDLAACESAGVAGVFLPSVEEMYPADMPAVVIELPQLSDVLEGKHRPGHFKGVCQVVAKLFNVIEPDAACFGAKDFQQLRILEAMTAALNFPVEIVSCPTMREPDGLAMSSRNVYLSADEHERALSIHRALTLAGDEFRGGVRQAHRLIALMQKTLLDPGQLGRVPVSIEYVAAVDPRTLRPVDQITGSIVLAIAARVGSTRLIDNARLDP